MIFPPAVTQHLAVNMATNLQKLKETLKKIDVETAKASVEADEVTTTLVCSELVLTSASVGYQRRDPNGTVIQ